MGRKGYRGEVAGLCRPYGHRLTSWVPLDCDAPEHEHRRYCCHVRVGTRSCGDVLIIPPLSAACTDNE